MNEFLISTDVDKIIRELRAAGAGGIEFRELLVATGLDADGLKKWLDVLEGHGSVLIEHRLTKQICYWTGEGAVESEEAEARAAQGARAAPFEKIASPAAAQGEDESADSGEEDELQKRIAELERALREQGVNVENEESGFENAGELVEGDMTEERGKPAQLGKRAARAGREEDYKQKKWIAPEEEEAVEEILNAKSAQDEEESKKEEIDGRSLKVQDDEGSIQKRKLQMDNEENITPASIGDENENGEKAPRVSPLASIRPKKVSRIKIPKAKPIDVSDYAVDIGEERAPKMPESRFKSKLSAHLQAISEQMDKIGKLKLEKEKLLRDVYSPLEQKLESEIDVISNRIMERERLILKLREAVASLPDKAAALESGYSKMRKLGGQAREQFDQTDTLLEESLTGLAEAKGKLDEEAESARQQITSQEVRLEELSRGMRAVGEQKDALAAAVDSAHALIVQESARLRKAQGAVERLAQLQAGIEGEVKGLQHNMAGQNRMLEDMERQLTTLAEIERWVGENRKEYSGMISQVEDYIGEADREYLSLREEVEANFVRRYLRELRVSTDNYQFEIEQAQERESGIDERIAKAKEKLSSMIAEGKKISYLYEMQAREEMKGQMEQMKVHEGQMLAVKAKSDERSAVQEIIGGIISQNEAALRKVEREEGAALAPRKRRAKVKMKIMKKKGKAAKAAKTAKAKKKGKKR